MTATLTATSPTATYAERAINMALEAGFEVDSHGISRRLGTYVHQLLHADGRLLLIHAGTGSSVGRFVTAEGYGDHWSSRTRTARSLPALTRLLAASPRPAI